MGAGKGSIPTTTLNCLSGRKWMDEFEHFSKLFGIITNEKKINSTICNYALLLSVYMCVSHVIYIPLFTHYLFINHFAFNH